MMVDDTFVVVASDATYGDESSWQSIMTIIMMVDDTSNGDDDRRMYGDNGNDTSCDSEVCWLQNSTIMWGNGLKWCWRWWRICRWGGSDNECNYNDKSKCNSS